MPTAIVAEPIVNATPTVVAQVTQVGDTWMKLNPWFDWQVFLGIPFWVFVGAFLVLVFIIVNAYWFFRIRKLASVKGYVDSLKGDPEDVMTWIVSTTKNLSIVCLKKRDNVLSFFDPVNITKWIHVARSAVIHIGGKGGVLVSEDYYRSRDIVSEMAICYACDDYNEHLGDLPHPTGPIKCFADYERFGRNALETLHPEGLQTPTYNIYDPNKFKKYFPDGLTAALKGAVIVRSARKLNLDNNTIGFWEKFIPLGAILGFLIIGIVAAWMVPLHG
jgi:hypothetical protein